MIDNYYIYICLDPRKSGRYLYDDVCFLFEPFYVGKGKGKRYKRTTGRNKYFKNKINKIKQSGLEPIIFKLYENLNEKQSFEKEIELIEEIGRFDLNFGPLLNMTDGGEGNSGLIFSEDHKKKIRENHIGTKGYHHTDEAKNKIGKKHKGKIISEETRIKIIESHKGKLLSDEHKSKLSKNHADFKGDKHPMFGKHHSIETKNKMIKSHKGKIIEMKTRNKISEKMKGENHPKHKLKEEQVIQIKLLLKEEILTQKEIAGMFGVGRYIISDIKRGKSWSYIKI